MTHGLVEQLLKCTLLCILYHQHLAEDTEGVPLFRATRAKILEGQKRAKRRVLFFFVIYIISGIISEEKAITKYGNTLYIGMDEVLTHYACTFENSSLHFHFQ